MMPPKLIDGILFRAVRAGGVYQEGKTDDMAAKASRVELLYWDT
jgi:hypothetical protein